MLIVQLGWVQRGGVPEEPTPRALINVTPQLSVTTHGECFDRVNGAHQGLSLIRSSQALVPSM